MNRLLTLLLALLLIAGCATKQAREEKAKQNYTDKLRQRVQIATYDSSPRGQVERIDIYDETHTISKPHKDIALVTCEGTPSEESPMTEAIIYRAKMIGADAIIILPPSRSGWGDRRVFRAKAVVYEKP